MPDILDSLLESMPQNSMPVPAQDMCIQYNLQKATPTCGGAELPPKNLKLQVLTSERENTKRLSSNATCILQHSPSVWSGMHNVTYSWKQKCHDWTNALLSNLQQTCYCRIGLLQLWSMPACARILRINTDNSLHGLGISIFCTFLSTVLVSHRTLQCKTVDLVTNALG